MIFCNVHTYCVCRTGSLLDDEVEKPLEQSHSDPLVSSSSSASFSGGGCREWALSGWLRCLNAGF